HNSKIIHNTYILILPLPSFTINLVLLSILTNSLQRDKLSKIKDQQELKTLSEKEDSVGERRLCRRKT
ncbi:unnamed protein product, partial [Brassica rapa subsp. trilocularis]